MGYWLYHPESECVLYSDNEATIHTYIDDGLSILSTQGKYDSVADLIRCLKLEGTKTSQYVNIYLNSK